MINILLENEKHRILCEWRGNGSCSQDRENKYFTGVKSKFSSSEKLKVHSFFQDEHSQKCRLAADQNSVLSIKAVGKHGVRLYFTVSHINSLSFKLFKENAVFEGQQLPH